jgi:hypothetical protein
MMSDDEHTHVTLRHAQTVNGEVTITEITVSAHTMPVDTLLDAVESLLRGAGYHCPQGALALRDDEER